MVLENIQSWIQLLRKKQRIWLKENLSTKDAGCIGGGKKTLSRLIKGGCEPQTFPTIAGHIGGKKPTDF
jgi:hypothetical protein